MPSLIHPKQLALPDCSANDTLLTTLGAGKRYSIFARISGDHNQTTHTRNTEVYDKPVLIIIIFLMFGLNLSVHLYCANYLMSHL